MVWPSGENRAAPTWPPRKVSRLKTGAEDFLVACPAQNAAAATSSKAGIAISNGVRKLCGTRRVRSRHWFRGATERRQVLQIEGQIARRLEALPRFLFQAVPDNAIESGRHIQSTLAQLGRIFLQDGVHGLDAGVALERAFSRDHFVENRAQAENVGVVVNGLPPHLLRRHVARRAHHRARLGGRGCGHGRALSGESGFTDGLFGQSEVKNFDPAVFGDEDVVGLQIAMHDTFIVRRGKPASHLHRVVGHAALRQRSGVHFFAQRLAFKQLRNQIVEITLCAYVVNGENIGMVDRAQHAGFMLEALQTVWIAGESFRQNLDRDFACQTGVARAIDFAHAARAY